MSWLRAASADKQDARKVRPGGERAASYSEINEIFDRAGQRNKRRGVAELTAG